MAFAIYRAPVDFVRPQTTTVIPKATYIVRAGAAGTVSGGDAELASRTVTLQISSADVPGASANTSVSILRAPVVLVHGLWAKGNAEDLRSLWTLKADSQHRFDVYVSDYGSKYEDLHSPQPDDGLPPQIGGSQVGIQFGASDTSATVRSAMNSFRGGQNQLGQPIASTQADFIAHSMGSLATRYLQYLPLFRSAQNFGQGYVHKVISLGGPHLGSPIALNLLKRNRLGDNGIDNSCVRKVIALAKGYYSIETYIDAEGTPRSGAVADLSGQGDGRLLSPALKVLAGHGSLSVAYVTGEMGAQETSALDGSPILVDGSPYYGDYSYTYAGADQVRKGTKIDLLKYIPAASVLGCSDPLVSEFTSANFSNFMGGGTPSDSDGIVPLNSQRNGQSNSVDLGYGFVHSGGAAALGLGTVDLQGDDPVGHVKTLLDNDATTEATTLLNTNIKNPLYVKGQ
jgi:triacylglycerol esterase/lipase EstA (alpha/beta hydrolase family)